MLNIVRFGPYCPHGFVPGNASLLLSLTSQNAFNMLEPTLLIRPITQPSPADVGSHNKNKLMYDISHMLLKRFNIIKRYILPHYQL